MVNQTGISLPQSDTQGWLASPGRRLVCFLAALFVISGVACLYFYQVSEISTLREETVQLQQEVSNLEHENASMMVDVARLNGPGYIQGTALERGMAPVTQASYLLEPVAKAPATELQVRTETGSWRAILTDLRERLFAGNSARDVAQVGP